MRSNFAIFYTRISNSGFFVEQMIMRRITSFIRNFSKSNPVFTRRWSTSNSNHGLLVGIRAWRGCSGRRNE